MVEELINDVFNERFKGLYTRKFGKREELFPLSALISDKYGMEYDRGNRKYSIIDKDDIDTDELKKYVMTVSLLGTGSDSVTVKNLLSNKTFELGDVYGNI